MGGEVDYYDIRRLQDQIEDLKRDINEVRRENAEIKTWIGDLQIAVANLANK